MLRMCVYMHSRFIEHHSIQILEHGPLIFYVVLSQYKNPHGRIHTHHALLVVLHL
jgi:hypothetical protein